MNTRCSLRILSLIAGSAVISGNSFANRDLPTAHSLANSAWSTVTGMNTRKKVLTTLGSAAFVAACARMHHNAENRDTATLAADFKKLVNGTRMSAKDRARMAANMAWQFLDKKIIGGYGKPGFHKLKGANGEEIYLVDKQGSRPAYGLMGNIYYHLSEWSGMFKKLFENIEVCQKVHAFLS